MQKGFLPTILLYLILFITLAFFATACSSSELQADKISTSSSPSYSTATVKPSITRSVSLTPTLTPSPSATPTLSFQLPPECQSPDPTIDPKIYRSYDFKSAPCEYPSISPDGSFIAFVTLAKVPLERSTDGVARVVRLFSTSSFETIQIYESRCSFLYPEWTPTGHLVISDVPYDVGCEYTAIYDLSQKRILAVLDGAVNKKYRNYWSGDKTAFFLLNLDVFGPSCIDNLSGFDLSSERKLPVVTPITPNTNIYAIIGEPIWMPDNKTLLATIRDGICSQDNEQDCRYKNSYIVAFNFSESGPKLSRPFYDPAIDYSFHQTEEGIVEFDAAPSKSLSCWDIHMAGDT